MATATITVTTPACMGCNQTSEVELTADEYERVTAKEAGFPKYLIQQALPERDADFRELVKSGIHGACWAAMFGPDPDPDPDPEPWVVVDDPNLPDGRRASKPYIVRNPSTGDFIRTLSGTGTIIRYGSREVAQKIADQMNRKG